MPEMGERRRIAGVVGVWDGTGWEPVSDEQEAAPAASSAPRTLPFKGGSRPVSEEEYQAAQEANAGPLSRGIASALEFGLSGMLAGPAINALRSIPSALLRSASPVGKAMVMASKIPTVRGGVRMAGQALQRVGAPPAASAVAEAAPAVAEAAGAPMAAQAVEAAAPVAKSGYTMAMEDMLAKMQAAQAARPAAQAAVAEAAPAASPVAQALQQAPQSALSRIPQAVAPEAAMNQSTALGSAMTRPGVKATAQADALKSAIHNWKVNDGLSNAQIVASLRETFGFPAKEAREAVSMVLRAAGLQ